jgi:4-hydroxy-3-polyprenylbenzoate decarboxylase
VEKLGVFLEQSGALSKLPLIVVVDDSEFTAKSWENFLWVTFTRSDPATDIYGVGAFAHCKHWGCRGSLIIDARLKTYHAPPLEDDPEVEKRVDGLGAPGGPLHGII